MKLDPIHQKPEDRLANSSENSVSAIKDTGNKIDKNTEAVKSLHSSINDKRLEAAGFANVVKNLKETNKGISDLKDFIDHPEVVVKKLEEVKSASLVTNQKLDKIHKAVSKEVKPQEFPKEMEVSLKGISVVTIKGDDGTTPKKGVDYYTPEEVASIKKEITPVKGKDYQDGTNGKTPKKGKDYFTEKEISLLKKEITPVKGKDYDDGKPGYTPIKGQDYDDGLDGSPDSPDEVVDKVNTASKKLEPKTVKGLVEVMRAVDSYGTNPIGKDSGGGGNQIKYRDSTGSVISAYVTDLKFGSGLTPTYSNGQISLTAAGGGSGLASFTSPNSTLSIGGTLTDPTADINLGNANTWTGQQTFNTTAPTFGTMTAGSVLFAGTGGLLSQDNANLFWDDTNNFLGIGTNVPTHPLTFPASSTGWTMYNNGDGSATYSRATGAWSSNQFNITAESTDGNNRTLALIAKNSGGANSTQVKLNRSGGFPWIQLVTDSTGTSSSTIGSIDLNGTFGATTSVTQIGVSIRPTYTAQTNGAGWTALLINAVDAGASTGVKLLQDWQKGGSSLVSVNSSGQIIQHSTANTQGIAFYNQTDEVTNYEKVQMAWVSNVFEIASNKAGTGVIRALKLSSGTAGAASRKYLQIMDNGTSGTDISFGVNASGTGVGTTNNKNFLSLADVQSINSAAVYTFVQISPTINQTSTAGYTVLLLNPTETATGSGVKRLISANIGAGAEVLAVDNTGAFLAGIWNATKIGLAYGGTNADLSATGGAGQYLKQASSGAAITVGTIPASDIASGAALTKTDDTNVTLTLGGTPATALLAAASLTLGWTGTLSVARGGSGAGTLTGILKGNGASAFTAVTAPSGALVGDIDSQTLTNKTLTSPVINTPTGIVKGDVGLGNVDNTSDATKNSASVTLTNKTITDGVNSVSTPTTTSIGYLGIPQNSQSAAYTTVMADSGKHVFHPVGDNNPRTFTIDSNANVAYPIGTAITFVNMINTVTIAITSDTLTLMGAGTTGSRTLAANGIATALKITSTSWVINGVNIT